MSTFVELTPDPFAQGFQDYADVQQLGRESGMASETFSHVRRPTRGIVLKEDTYATIEVRSSNGRIIPLIDAGGNFQGTLGQTARYSNFLLQQVNESREEKQQVVLTFGEPYIFFFGEQPRIIQCTGVLMNTADFNWRAEFWHNYDNFLRGTKCVENGARVYLSWDDIVVEGYLMGAQASENVQQQHTVQLQFTMFLTNYMDVSNIGRSLFPGSADVNVNPLDPTLSDAIEAKTGSYIDVSAVQAAYLKGATKQMEGATVIHATSTVSTALGEGLKVGAKSASAVQGVWAVKNSLLNTLRSTITDSFLSAYGDVQAAIATARDKLLGSGTNSVSIPKSFIEGGTVESLAQQYAVDKRRVILSSKYGPPHIIQQNYDEYVARTENQYQPSGNLMKLNDKQYMDPEEVATRMTVMLRAYGYYVEGALPNVISSTIKKGGFGMVNLPPMTDLPGGF